MKRTMHVVFVLPVEVLDDSLSKENVASLVLQKLVLKTRKLRALGATATVYGITEAMS